MSDLPNDAPLSYNGVVFPVGTEILGVNIRPNPDSSGRTTKSNTYTITAKAIMAIEATGAASPGVSGTARIGQMVIAETDTQMELLRTRLSKRGAALVCRNRGLGADFVVNADPFDPTGIRDVEWGPVPEILQWKPLGHNDVGGQAAELIWRVSTTFPDCPNTTAFTKNIYEWNYSLSYHLDHGGLTRKTHTGHVSIPQSKKNVNSTTLSDDADRLRDVIKPEVPFGFRRESQGHNLSEDKCKLTFTFVDTQIEAYAPPQDVVQVDARHEVNSTGPYYLQSRGTFTATYELPFNIHRTTAKVVFFNWVRDRLKEFDKAKEKVVFYPEYLSVTEAVYDRRAVSFALRYGFTLSDKEVDKILAFNGFWKAPPDSDWGKWSKTMTLPWDVRGFAGLAYDRSQEVIIDLCKPLQPKKTAANTQSPAQRAFTPREQAATAHAPEFVEVRAAREERDPLNDLFRDSLKRADPKNTYIDVRCDILVEVLDETVMLKPLPQQPIHYAPGRRGDGWMAPYTGTSPSIIQYRAAPTVFLTLVGYALRIGYPIEAPEILSVEGVRPAPANVPGQHYFRTGVIGNLLTPVTMARWKLRWMLPNVPREAVGPPTNPLWGGPGPKPDLDKAGVVKLDQKVDGKT